MVDRRITDIVNEGEALGVVGGVAASLPRGLLTEEVDDRVAALLTAGSNVTLTYDDVAGTLTIAASGGGGVAVEDEGVEVLASATRFDFTGTGVTVTDGGSGQANVSISGGAGAALLHVRDEKAAGTAAGTFTAGAWQTRTLNTIATNEISGATLTSNEVSLPAGTYEVDATSPAYNVGRHKARLYNVTGTAVLVVGASDFAPGGSYGQARVRGRFTLTSTSSVRLEHRCDATQASNGLGVESNYGIAEVYADLMIRKVA